MTNQGTPPRPLTYPGGQEPLPLPRQKHCWSGWLGPLDPTDPGGTETPDQWALRSRALDALEEGILLCAVGRTGLTVLDANPALERLTGHAVEEVVGRPLTFLLGARADEATLAELRRAVGELTSCRVEIPLHTRDGTPCWVSLVLRPLEGDCGGGFTHYLAVLRDITEEKAIYERYLQSQKLEAIGRLTGGVAHDFNNLLTIVNGYADLLLGMGLPAEVLQPVQQIHQAGEQAARLTAQLLTFSRRHQVRFRVVDLNEIVSGMLRLIQRLIGDDVEVVTRLDARSCPVRADVAQMEQVLMNLAVNARDAMPGGGRLLLHTRRVRAGKPLVLKGTTVPAGEYVLLTVRDTGCGMSAEVRRRLFEPFFTTKEAGKGTGLGLPTVRSIVEQLGGHLAVSSAPGRGSTFRVYLPARAEAERQLADGAPAPTPPRGSETILLVEDQENVLRLAVRGLEQCGYRVLPARGVEKALRWAEEYPGVIHLLLTDVVLPARSGWALAGEVASIRPGIKVLYTSGCCDDVVLRHGPERGGVSFLQKPYTLSILYRKIREALEGGAPPKRGGLPEAGHHPGRNEDS